MSVGTNTTHKEVDTTIRFDLLFVTGTLSIQIGSITIQDIGILRIDINMVEEIIPHERIVAFGMFFRQADIFIHIKSNYIPEGNNSFLVQVD